MSANCSGNPGKNSGYIKFSNKQSKNFEEIRCILQSLSSPKQVKLVCNIPLFLTSVYLSSPHSLNWNLVFIYPCVYLSKKVQEIEAASAFIRRGNGKFCGIKRYQEQITTVKDVLGKRRKALFEAVLPLKKEKIKTLPARV